MPVGLPDRSGQGGRGPEQLIRPLLGARQSSVFSVPARAAVEAPDYPSACAIALTCSDPPRKVSKQCFNIFPKIIELDRFLRENPPWVPMIFEVHPELAFWRLNDCKPLGEPKKVKGRVFGPGMALRQGLLARGGIDPVAIHAKPPRGAAQDDLLDALAALSVARRLAGGKAQSYPAPVLRDRYDLPVGIWV